MKLKYPVAVLAAAFMLAGCEQIKQAGQFTPEPQATAKTYPVEHRAQFVTSMQENLTDMDRKLAELGDTITMLQDNAVADDQLNALRELRAQLDFLLEDLTKSNAESWDEARRIFESAWANLRLAYKVVKATYDS